jgi:isoaspartyl peptidase/L-asparaginase-like protein (Ntn-hydrolase superfamily)
MVSVYDIFKRSTINCKIFVLTLGMTAQNAVEESLRFMNSRVKGAGGAICISASGEAAFHFTTERMAWAIAKADVLSWGLDPNERNTEIMA